MERCDSIAVSDQLQSILFRKLSAEIRSMIWQEVILDSSHSRILHIISKDRALTHIQCNAPEGGYKTSRVSRDSWGTEHEHCYFFAGSDHAKDGKVKQCRIFPLMLTCRRIHREATAILYSVCTFSLIGPSAASRFLSTISPQASTNIRRLTLTWMAQEAKDGIAAWAETWKLISTLPNLRSMHVAIYDCYTAHLEEELLAPLMECKVEEFLVDLPWHAKEGADYVDPPFRILRPKPGENKTYLCDDEITICSIPEDDYSRLFEGFE